jgi:hypothetical protein
MIEVKFDTYKTYFDAFHWCMETFGICGSRWKAGHLDRTSHVLLFKNNEDAMLCALRWA